MNTWLVYLVTGVVLVDAERIEQLPDGIEFWNGKHQVAMFASYLGWERHPGVMSSQQKSEFRDFGAKS